MQVGIVGAGPIAQGAAAQLAQRGHTPLLWSPRGSRVDPASDKLRIRTRGTVTIEVDAATVPSPAGLANVDVILFCVLGNGHRAVMDKLAPHVRQEQSIVIFSHCSLGALYLSKLLAGGGIAPMIVALGTTLTGGPIIDGEVQMRYVRSEMDVTALPAAATPKGVALLQALFGDLFVLSENLLAIALSNLNPQIHMALSMLNLTRMEQGETWDNFGTITECVGRLVEALDEERLAIAAAFGVRVRTAREHYLKSFPNLLPGTVHQMAQAVSVQRAGSSPGPKTIHNRWLTEDLPFGIAARVALAEVARVTVPLHAAGLALLSAAMGCDFNRENDLLPALGLGSMSLAGLQRLAREGWPR